MTELKQQNGMVLMVGILMLLVLTIVGVGLTSNSQATLQLSAAGVQREESLQAAHSAQTQFLVLENSGTTEFLIENNSAAHEIIDSDSSAKNIVSFIIETNCRRRRNASSANALTCRESELRTEVNFGKGNRGVLSITSGIEKTLPNPSGG